MGITSKSLLNLLYYKKLPQIYRDEDKKLEYPLKRYLESLIDGGFYGSIEDIERVLLLIDPENIPEEFFPYLYESFGLEYFPDIDISYQRKFLMNIGELIKRRGTYSSVQFLVKVLTGLEAELSLEGNTLNIVLPAKNLGQIDNIDTSMRVIGNFIQTQIPYFITPVINSRIDTQIIPSKSYSHSSMGSYKFYEIKSYTIPMVEVKIINEVLVVSIPVEDIPVPEVEEDALVWPIVEVEIRDDVAVAFINTIPFL